MPDSNVLMNQPANLVRFAQLLDSMGSCVVEGQDSLAFTAKILFPFTVTRELDCMKDPRSGAATSSLTNMSSLTDMWNWIGFPEGQCGIMDVYLVLALKGGLGCIPGRSPPCMCARNNIESNKVIDIHCASRAAKHAFWLLSGM